MEEDIKILEEWIEISIGNAPEWVKSDEILKLIDYKQIKAIENLIKGYRELEKAIKQISVNLEILDISGSQEIIQELMDEDIPLF